MTYHRAGSLVERVGDDVWQKGGGLRLLSGWGSERRGVQKSVGGGSVARKAAQTNRGEG